MFAFENSLKNG